MRKEEKTEREDITSKLEVHFIENVEETESKAQPGKEAAQAADAQRDDADARKDPEDDISACGDDMKKDSTGEDSVKEDPVGGEKAGEEVGDAGKDAGEEAGTQTARKDPEDPEEPIYRVTGETAKKSHKVRSTLAGLLVILIAAAAFVSYPAGKEFFNEKTVKGNAVEVEISKGSTSKEVGKVLKEKGVIRSEAAFLLKLYLSDYKGKLRYGTFELNDGMSLSKVIKELATQDGQKETAFTVPEGYTIEMTAAKLEKEKIMSAQDFLTAVENAAETSEYKDLFPDKEKVYYQLQGYIYPDTYNVTEDTTADELVAMILKEFDSKFDADRQEQAKKLGMTVEEVLIRASLVQKETEKPEEYPVIAGVIQNRLDKGMKLQFDSTVVYAITKGQYGMSRVLYSDLKVKSPYNTYKHKGLPVGPICSPGLEAIDGVLNPQEHDYLYFQMDTTKNDGSNIFNKTYEEHKAASATTTSAKEETTGTDAASTAKETIESTAASTGTKKNTETDTSADTAGKSESGTEKKTTEADTAKEKN